MKKLSYLLGLALAVAMSLSLTSCGNSTESESATAVETESSAAAKKDSPIYKLFESEQSLRDGLIGKCFVSADQTCLVDFHRKTRYKIFIKETPNSDWTQFNGEEYRITYNSKDEVCIEFDKLTNIDDLRAKGIFTPSELALTIDGQTLKFRDFKIVTNDESRTIYENGSK